MQTERPWQRPCWANIGVDEGKQETQRFPLPKRTAPERCPTEAIKAGGALRRGGRQGKSDPLPRSCVWGHDANSTGHGKDKAQARPPPVPLPGARGAWTEHAVPLFACCEVWGTSAWGNSSRFVCVYSQPQSSMDTEAVTTPFWIRVSNCTCNEKVLPAVLAPLKSVAAANLPYFILEQAFNGCDSG